MGGQAKPGTKKRWTDERAKREVCIWCGNKSDNKRLCSQCTKMAVARNKKVRDKRKANGLCTYCGRSSSWGDKSECKTCVMASRKRGRKTRIRDKQLCLDHYGRLCMCCGESGEPFLTLDHINEDGYKHRKKTKNRNIFSWLVTHDFPSGFQILCMNCNMAKAQNGGICPHKEGV